MASFVGRLTFDLPLPPVASPTGIALRAMLATLGAAAATLDAASRAARLTVRDGLARR